MRSLGVCFIDSPLDRQLTSILKKGHGHCLLALLAFFVSGVTGAGPWLDPGDSGLRNEIQLLADAGVITSPVTTWPIVWADVAKDLVAFEDVDQLSGVTADAYRYLRQRIAIEKRIGGVRASGYLAGVSKPTLLRTFENTTRESGEAGVGIEWMGNSFAYGLNVQVISNAQDEKTYRVDDSYIAFIWKNQMFSVSTQQRWWGPGWEGSLILSSNARPIPVFSLQRSASTPFKSKWLSWIGPWTYQFIYGQLEQDRAVPNARLWGLRVGFRPAPSLEIGLSRTAQWCGAGRPCGFDTFIDLLKGTKDNRGPNLPIEEEPGNQLAGLDFRWVPSGERLPLALYGQFTAEDEADGYPSRYIALGGIEIWGERTGSFLPGSYRIHLEATNTTLNFYDDIKRFDSAYEHGIYLDGYRYRGRPIGHSIDNDGEMYSLGLVLTQEHGKYWNFLLRRIRLNVGGTRANSVSAGNDSLWSLSLNRQWDSAMGEFNFGVGYDDFDADAALDDEGTVFFRWTKEL